ncbi:MAG TPA: ammonium transporter [Dehalococcoidia bacterium]|nr:ammonium transporter [Dehalococcoidia bacterium]
MEAGAEMQINAGDTAWVLASAALVLFMTPGLALFYGGMVRAKNVLNMLMKNFFTITTVTVVWVLIGYTLAFGPDAGGGLIGKLDFIGMRNITGNPPPNSGLTIPDVAFVCFQMMFAIITPALITGAIAERTRFSAWVVFSILWSLIVYMPVAHWAFATDGWIYKMGARDFAGGLVVHINAGIAALACVLVLGPRRGFRKEAIRPHNLTMTLLGAGILWFGWFGFNAGSALAANAIAARAFLATHVAAATAAGAWVAFEWWRIGKPTTLGAASGAVAGLVAITPCAGFVNPLPAMLIGVVAGAVCFYAVGLKFRFGYDDSLDVVGVHLVGGIAGSILLGVFAQKSANAAGADGLLFGNAAFFGKQIVAVLAVLAFSFVVSYILARIVDAVVGMRVDDESEVNGLDLALHEERAYIFSE